MSTVHLVFGPQGAGKTTHARALAARVGGVRFSIDEWMAQLFLPDLPPPMDLAWIMARVQRCERRIWASAMDIAATGRDVVLDLGLMQARHRRDLREQAQAAGHVAQLHFVDAPPALRRERVVARNLERGETFAFEVTPAMFDVMEARFEPPNDEELVSSSVG
ncbi:MAG TPA: ATP-binding protein [Pseudomonadota bacterium]|jgi:predicted kinase|nr:ATP-binding protein [Pseudomonadota bacterium]